MTITPDVATQLVFKTLRYFMATDPVEGLAYCPNLLCGLDLIRTVQHGKQIEAAYIPCSEHTAAIGIELSQRIRGQGESLHILRDDIYEKVSNVYADCTESEQDNISVEIFSYSLADAELVQKLLEEKPRTLARMYKIALKCETPRRATRAFPQLMQPDLRNASERRPRAAMVHESASVSALKEPMGVADERAAEPANSPIRTQRSHQQWQSNKAKPEKTISGEVICHNCSGVGHIQRNHPSPGKPKRHSPSARTAPVPDADSGTRRNVLPLRHFNAIPIKSRPQIHPSIVHVLQGIGPEVLTAHAHLDYGHREITLFGVSQVVQVAAVTNMNQ
ncbi:unnamed protein product [Pleuronectes platessa]|uniref:Uncharacterized protein n=1 Tax=Pleuronectes platessa TaxID=8262 RepID=A0A9N7UV20_PLEPL|nr:unnamed protein product [Pleuronectes platessa]